MKNVNNSDDQNNLWAKIIEGDAAAFEHLYSQYSQTLYQYGLKFTPKIQIIEDCMQDLFTRIFRNHKNLSPTDNVKFYLMKSFRNNLIRLIEKEKKYSFEKVEDYHFEILFSAEHEIVTSEEEQKKHKILVEGLNKLSARQKEAIYLRYTKGLEYDEITMIMEMSVESCRNIIYRAIKSLRDQIKSNNIILLLIFKNML